VWSHRGEYLAYLYRLDADTLGSIRHRRFAYTRDLAKEHAMKIDDEAQYLAFTALTTETQRQRRHPTAAEDRQIIAAAWNLEQ